ncbi:hypothetical protein YTPLAS72_13300 [Nitrospira sp.]|nr:hypothetical protein YTPLAS72_13300 [Nitrospira sp.]
MSKNEDPYQEGKRAGAHPLLVVFGTLIGLWLFVALIIPSSRNKQASGTEGPTVSVIEDPEAIPVMFTVDTTIPDMNVLGLVVPSQATDSQIVALLKTLRDARLDGSLGEQLPATTPGHKLGDHAIADIFIFSDKQFAEPDTIRTLARGAHAPGTLYPNAIPFEVAMEHVRGYYRIDLSDTASPDTGSLGFADESGVHSKHHRRIF